MKIYFHALSKEDELFDTDGSFCYNDKHYWQYVEYGTNPGGLQEVTITDGCDRIMPISVDAIPLLIRALERAQDIHLSILAGEENKELAESDAEEAPEQDLGW
jgi:hypothetical protein